MKQERKRLNIYLYPEIADYIAKEAERMGVSMGAAISVMITRYKEDRETTQGLTQLVKLVEEQKK